MSQHKYTNQCKRTKYRRKLLGLGARDGGGKQMKRRGTYATVASLSGPQPPVGCSIREIKCPIPRTKREKYLLGNEGR